MTILSVGGNDRPRILRSSQLATRIAGILFCLLVLLLGWANFSIAQSYVADSYSEDDGLASSIAYDLVQDNNGELLVVTKNGVNRFDGHDWLVYPNNLHLPNSRNSRFIRTASGQIFLFGLYYDQPMVFSYHGDNWKAMRSPGLTDKLAPEYVLGFDVLERSNSSFSMVIGLHREAMIYRSEVDEWRSITLPEQFNPRSFIRDVYFHKEHLYLLSSEGMWRQESDESWHQVNPSTPSQDFVRMQHDPNTGGYVILGNGWLGAVNNEHFTLLVPEFTQLQEYLVKSADLHITPNQEVFFGVNSYYHVFNPIDSTHQRLDFSRQIESQYYNNLLLDRENNVWISTDRGLARIRDLRFYFYDHRHGLNFNEISGLHALPDSSLIVGSNYALGKLSKEGYEDYFEGKSDGDVTYRFSSIQSRKDGSIWFSAFEKGVGKWTEEKGVSWVAPSPFDGLPLSSIHWWNDSLLVSINNKVLHWNGTSYSHYYSSKDYVRRMITSSQGRLFILGNNGIYRKSSLGEPAKHYSGTDGREKVYDLADYSHEKIVATDVGLCHLKEDKIQYFILGDTLIKRPIYELLVDRNQGLWLGTDRGLLHYHPHTGWDHFHKSHGVIGNDINRFTLVELPDGRIAVGSDNGISIFDASKQFYTSKVSPIPHLYSIKANGNQEFDWKKGVSLESHENGLEISFGAVAYRQNDHFQYRYRLLGNDTTWQKIWGDGRLTRSYLNLWGGTYQFQFQVRLEKGEWSNILSSGEIEVEHPFFRQWWFLLGLLLAFTGLGSLTNRMVYFRRMESKLQERVKQSTEIIRQSEAELRMQNDQLTKANLELDRFVYQVAHDLRGPLMKLKGLVNLHRLEAEAVDEILPFVDDSVEQMDHFISEIIDFAKNHRVDVEGVPIEFKGLVQEVFHALDQSRNDIQFHFSHIVKQDVPFISDPFRIQAVLNNLISNAMDFYDPQKPEATIKVTVTVDETQAVIVVTDNGQGIPKEMQSAVFDMFYRGSNSSTGSGLGLYIVKEVVTKLNGIIDLSSEEGLGTEVTVRLRNQHRDNFS